MKNHKIHFLVSLSILFFASCSSGLFRYDEHSEMVFASKIDTLNLKLKNSQELIAEQQLTIDNLYNKTENLKDSIRYLNSSIRIKEQKEFPDTLSFVSYKFDLTNPRYKKKFEYWYKAEIKFAYKYIPRTSKYFPIIEQILKKNDLPDDIKYLAVAESYLSPFAGSSAGAKGYWQFIKSTAELYDIKIDKFVDQRSDIFVSTQAACDYLLWSERYLKKLDSNDLLLALCSYNAGMGNVSRIIREQGETDFFKLIQHKKETDEYIWRTLAIKYIIENEDKIFTKPFAREENLLENNKLVKLKLNGYYKIDKWAQAQGTYIKKIWELNTWINIYKRKQYRYSAVNDIVLAPGKYNILVPKSAKPRSAELKRIERNFLNDNDGYFVTHRVKRGENLYLIAQKYHTSVSKLQEINNLGSSIIYPGQKLQLFSQSITKKHYLVKKNDTIGKISEEIGVSINHLMKSNNLKYHKVNGHKIVYIYPGQKLTY